MTIRNWRHLSNNIFPSSRNISVVYAEQQANGIIIKQLKARDVFDNIWNTRKTSANKWSENKISWEAYKILHFLICSVDMSLTDQACPAVYVLCSLLFNYENNMSSQHISNGVSLFPSPARVRNK